MHSRDQLKALKKKSRPKTRGRKKLVNRKFTEFVPTLVESGMLSGGPSLLDGGPYAAVEVLNSLGITLVDRPINYSFSTDPDNSQEKKELKNKNILRSDQINQENSEILVSEYFANTDDSIFVPEIEKRNNKKSIRSKTTNNPNENIKIDLSLFVVGLAMVSTMEQNGGTYVDQDFIRLRKV
tara:strand:- start:9328 stop:9873 length:546 start_codon:yes stop_codon:yes gene_type:complete